MSIFRARHKNHRVVWMFKVFRKCLKVSVFECLSVIHSVTVLAEISLRSPGKLFIFNLQKFIYWMKVSKYNFMSFSKKTLVIQYGILDVKCTKSQHMVMCNAWPLTNQTLSNIWGRVEFAIRYPMLETEEGLKFTRSCYTGWSFIACCRSGSCFKTLMKNVIVWIYSSHTVYHHQLMLVVVNIQACTVSLLIIEHRSYSTSETACIHSMGQYFRCHT